MQYKQLGSQHEQTKRPPTVRQLSLRRHVSAAADVAQQRTLSAEQEVSQLRFQTATERAQAQQALAASQAQALQQEQEKRHAEECIKAFEKEINYFRQEQLVTHPSCVIEH